MGTRADFWIQNIDDSLEWIGSTAWDGHVSNFTKECAITNKDDFRASINEYLARKQDSTKPEQGWPWPWEYTGVSDVVYVFREKFNKVFLFEPMDKNNKISGRRGVFADPLGDYYIEMPNMECISNVTKGKRSGVMFIGANGVQDIPDPVPAIPFPPAIFKMCPFCDTWIPPVNGTCECTKYYGDRITGDELDEWSGEPIIDDAKNNKKGSSDEEIKRGFAWTFDENFYYRAFYIHETGELTLFKKPLKPEEYQELAAREKHSRQYNHG